jgi:hypothetical protein
LNSNGKKRDAGSPKSRHLPEVACYGQSGDAAVVQIQAVVLRVIAGRLEHGEVPPELVNVMFEAA